MGEVVRVVLTYLSPFFGPHSLQVQHHHFGGEIEDGQAEVKKWGEWRKRETERERVNMCFRPDGFYTLPPDSYHNTE